MQKYLLMLLCLSPLGFYAQSGGGAASKNTLKLRGEIEKIIKKNALYSDSLDWKTIKAESKNLVLNDNDSISQKILFDFYKTKLREAGDKHSVFIPKYFMDKKKEQPIAILPTAAYLGDGVGLIKVPGLMTFNDEKDLEFANIIRAEIKKVDTQNTVTNWVVDLRHNTGGNMWPMLAGINALLEDGTVGYFIHKKGKEPWVSQNGLIQETIKTDDYKVKNKPIKIAVLIDDRTGSSGEMAALSLLGMPNVKSFGTDSAGYTTANNTFPLSNGANLYLASSFSADRTGKIYPEKITPDVAVTDDKNTAEDEVVEEAKRWLRT